MRIVVIGTLAALVSGCGATERPGELVNTPGDAAPQASTVVAEAGDVPTVNAAVDLGGEGGSPLVSQQSVPTELAVDDANLYWINLDSYAGTAGSIVKMPLPQSVPVVLAQGQYQPRSLVVAGDDVYWATGQGCIHCTDGKIQRVPRAGGAVQVLASNQTLPVGLVIQGGYLYWVNEGWIPPATGGSIKRLALDGGASDGAASDGGALDGREPEDLVTEQPTPTSLMVRDGRLYWTTCGTETGAMMGRSTYAMDGQVLTMPIGGDTATPLASDQSCPSGIARTGHAYFWSTIDTNSFANDEGKIALVSLPDGAGAPITREMWTGQRSALAVDGDQLYWLALQTLQTAKDGPSWPLPQQLLQFEYAGSASIALDATHVYVSDGLENGSIARLSR